jgi:hypothetical protein
MKFPKPVKWRSKKFLDFVSRQLSFFSGKMDYDPNTGEQRTIPHHFGPGSGKGVKCSDVYVIPLTNDEHRKVHDGAIHIDEWQAMECALDLLNEYLVENNIK